MGFSRNCTEDPLPYPLCHTAPEFDVFLLVGLPIFIIGLQGEQAKGLMAEFNLGCDIHDYDHEYRVYVTTFLGYGANVARSRYEKMMINYDLNIK